MHAVPGRRAHEDAEQESQGGVHEIVQTHLQDAVSFGRAGFGLASGHKPASESRDHTLLFVSLHGHCLPMQVFCGQVKR